MEVNPILVTQNRGNIIESFHRGVVCVVDENKKVLFSVGNIHQPTYPRSALKLLQIIPLIESGAADFFQFTDQEIAVMCGSHNGEEQHVNTVQSILNKIGLDSSLLRCGAHPPFSILEAERFFRDNQTATGLHNNCSGKHAGFLALSVYMGAPLQDYLQPEHPVQKSILKSVMKMTEITHQPARAIDGCSAPIYALTPFQQSVGYMNLIKNSRTTTDEGRACLRIIDSVSTYPEMVAGADRYDTQMMQTIGDRVIGKVGAEGIFCLAFRNKGLGACIKIDDGKMLPQYLVAQKLIVQLESLSIEEKQTLSIWEDLKINNWNGIQTGEHHGTDALHIVSLNRE
jgi:L-asparaginase II